MRKRIVGIVGVLAAALLLGGCFHQPKEETQAPTPTPAGGQIEPAAEQPVVTSEEEARVVYSDSGFSPATLRVKVGTQVTFVNESAKMMWVASAPHPVHTDLPSFDPRVGIEKGMMYRYRFQQVGTFKYHNHLSTSDTGSIVVVE